jgi:hypothetical protein
MRKKYLVPLTSALMTFILTSIVWAITPIHDKDQTLDQLAIINQQNVKIAMLENKISSMQSEKLELVAERDDLKQYEFKYNLLAEIEQRRKLKVSTQVIDAIYKVSQERDYDVPFLLAWGDTEASLRSNPRPWRPVKGIVQINYAVWRNQLDLDKHRMGDPYYNLHKGIDVLEVYLQQADGDMERALFLYNNGPSGKYNNQRYAPKILRKQAFYAQIVSDVSS